MLKVSAKEFIELGEQIDEARVIFIITGNRGSHDPGRPLKPPELENLKKCLIQIFDLCQKLDLPVSGTLKSSRFEASDEENADPYTHLPKTLGEYDILTQAAMAELKNKLFLFVPATRAKYYELTLQSTITTAFPSSSKELVASGNCLAAGFYTASVFHAMRAAERGVRVLGEDLGVSFPDKPIELAEWANILDQADSRVAAMKARPKGTQKDQDLKFYSQAAIQFRYFKDAWRVRVAHARETFEENQAIQVFTHTLEFFEVLATRLKEPKASV
jgi:hypothetical protein